MRPLRFTVEARRDLDDLYLYGLLNFGSRQADAYLDRLVEIVQSIAEQPLMARERTEVRPPIRLLPWAAHHIFYDVAETEVVIVRILHGSADWMHKLER